MDIYIYIYFVVTANGNQSCEPSVVSTETANNSSLQINGVDTNANGK